MNILRKPNPLNKIKWNVIDVLIIYSYVFSVSMIINGFLFLFNIDRYSIAFEVTNQVLSSILFVLATYFTIKYKYKTDFFHSMGIKLSKLTFHLKKGLLIAVFLMLGTILINIISMYLFHAPQENPYEEVPEQKLKIISILAVFVAPIIEEIMFRGVLQPSLIRKCGTYSGVLLTALFFGFAHLQYADYSTALWAIVSIGLILGIAKEKYKSIMPGIFAHLINNIFAAMALF